MRTFQELHAKELTDAVMANLAGDVETARVHSTKAAEWYRIDRAAEYRKDSGQSGAHRA